MKKALKTFAVLLLALMLWDAWLTYFHVPGWAPLFISDSPDGRFSVSVYYNLPSPFFGEPSFFEDPWGGGGTVVLRENKTGKVLQCVRTDYVDDGVPHVDWFPESNRVGVISVDVWDLPPEEPEK